MVRQVSLQTWNGAQITPSPVKSGLHVHVAVLVVSSVVHVALRSQLAVVHRSTLLHVSPSLSKPDLQTHVLRSSPTSIHTALGSQM